MMMIMIKAQHETEDESSTEWRSIEEERRGEERPVNANKHAAFHEDE